MRLDGDGDGAWGKQESISVVDWWWWRRRRHGVRVPLFLSFGLREVSFIFVLLNWEFFSHTLRLAGELF